MILIWKITPQKVNRKRMRDREKEVCLATKSSQGPPPQRDKYACKADMDAMIHVYKHLCWPCLKDLHQCTSLKSKCTICPSYIPVIMPQNIPYPEGIVLCNIYILKADHGRTPRLVITSLAACHSSKTYKQVTQPSRSLWDCAVTSDEHWPSNENLVR